MNTKSLLARVVAAAALSVVAAAVSAQAPVRPPYGPGINLETAKKIAAGAAAEAKKNNWNMAVAIVDNHGMLIYYEIADDTQTAAATVAVDKARTSALWRRPSKEFEENVAGGRVAILRPSLMQCVNDSSVTVTPGHAAFINSSLLTTRPAFSTR